MKIYTYPQPYEWPEILKRPVADLSFLQEKIKLILDDVKQNGNHPIAKYTQQFDGVSLKDFAVTKDEIMEADSLVPDELKMAIGIAANNIKKFHAHQILNSQIIETMPGVQCWRKNVAIEKVGLYIPGGTAPLFSTLLMLAIPAQLAGCKDIIICSPPQKNGKLHPSVLFCAKITGCPKIFKIGGVQAIGAMAYGTQTVPKVYKIFGPGNQFVTAAKQFVQQQGTAIDMTAGPSEVCIFADESADVSFVAADLLAQAEHGADSQVLLVTTSDQLIEKIHLEIATQLLPLPRRKIIEQALQNSMAVLVHDMEEGTNLINDYAPEHLILCCKNEEEIAEKIINAGSVFIGNYSPESVGDYASGTNHTLPTNGFAKVYSGVSIDSFVKKITFQQLTHQGLRQISNTVIEMAEAEGLQAHANAVKVRLAKEHFS